MTEPTLLSRMRMANESFLAGTPRWLDASGDPFALVACIDPRLTGLLEPALGLPRNRAILIRTAGNRVTEETHDALRSLAVALYVKGAREVFIVGHTDCGMAGFSASLVAENFRKAGIVRTAFGHEDLRTWFGAFAGIRENVIQGTGYLRRSGIVAPAVKIHGLLLDSERGALEVLVDGDLTPADALIPQGEPLVPPEAPRSEEKTELQFDQGPDAKPAPVLPPVPQTAPKTGKGPIVVPTAPAAGNTPPAPPASVLEAATILRDFFDHERHSRQMQKAQADLKAVWARDKSPAGIFAALEALTREYEARYPRVPGALAYLRHAVRTGGADRIGFADAMRRILS